MAKITFDGPNKLMIVSSSVTTLNVKEDLYSDWKEWILEGDNSKYQRAFRVVGGDPTVGSKFAGSIFFVQNGWKIHPDDVDHELVLDGDIYGDGGAEIIQARTGRTITVRVESSNLAQGIEVGVLEAMHESWLKEVWQILGLDVGSPASANTTARSAGSISQTISESGGTVTVQRN